MIELYSHQLKALEKMKNGCILCGDVGSGKSITALGYFYLRSGGPRSAISGGEYTYLKEPIKDLYIITTARKRDTLEWEDEMVPFLFTTDEENALYFHKVVVDSWNNIKKYSDIENAFFIFDEQRVVGNGAWVKAFLKIARGNEWILLSATPGDTWMDYVPVFIANGYYRNRSEFYDAHIIWARGTTYPKVQKYYNEGKLLKIKSEILIEMPDVRSSIQHHEDIFCEYNKDDYRKVYKDRWDIFENKPIENASKWCYLQRKVVNLDESREVALLELLEDHERAIIFYNFNYELERIKSIIPAGLPCAEWNGRRHDSIPETSSWVFLVQYAAGAEGWNCIRTDTIIYWSENYSYRVMKQSSGRIDRINTTYKDLWYYHLKTHSPIDNSIMMALKRKKDFNVRRFAGKKFYERGNNQKS